MLVLSIGDKGSGKSALLRKLVWSILAYHRPPRPSALVFWHDAACQIRGPVFESVAAWRACAAVPLLSVFRGVDVEDLARLAVSVRDVTLVLDELDMCSDSSKRWTAPTVRAIAHYTRHYRINLFGGFRAPRNVPEDFFSLADHIFLFHCDPDAAYDIRALAARFGPDVAHAVSHLPSPDHEMGHFIIRK